MNEETGVISQAVCGETTEPKRGWLEYSIGKCECNSLSTDAGGTYGPVQSVFDGEACAGYSVYSKKLGRRVECAGHGTFQKPKFPYGTCSTDFVAFTRDALFHPFIEKVHDSRDSKWVWRAHSIFTHLNLTYRLLNDEIVYMRDVYSDAIAGNISTCGSQTKPYLPSIRFDKIQIPAQRVSFNVTVWQLINNCVSCACDSNGDIFPYNPACITTYALYYSGLDNLIAYPMCRAEWVSEIDPGFFNETGANYRELDSVRKCVKEWNVVALDVDAAPIAPENATLVCVDAFRVRYDRNVYGTFQCNNVVQRNIDKAIWLALGPGNYTLQCASEPIQPYSNTLGAFYGLFDYQLPGLSFLDEVWGEEQYRFVAQVLNGERWFRFDPETRFNETVTLLSEDLLDDYLISWVSPYLNVTFTPYQNLTKYTGNPNASGSFEDLLNQILQLFQPIGVAFQYLDQNFEWKNPALNQFGSPLQQIDLVDVLVNRRLYELFQYGRNYSTLYSQPGLAALVANMDRTNGFFNGYAVNFTSSVNTIRITFPVDLDDFYLLSRSGQMCCRVVSPKRGDVVDCYCFNSTTLDPYDPFVYDQQYVDYLNATLSALSEEWNYYYETDPGNETILVAIAETFLLTIATEGVGMTMVPESFYSVSPSVNVSWTLPVRYGRDHQFGPNQSVDLGLMYFEEWRTQFNVSEAPQNWLSVGMAPAQFSEAWRVLEELIVLNRTLPINEPLRAAYAALSSSRDGGGDLWSRPIDFEDENDLIYLKRIWATFLAPRRCSRALECSNFGLGDACIFDEMSLYVPWRSGDPTVPTNHLSGDEGGCTANQNFQQGFWDPQTFNQACVSGYGPVELVGNTTTVLDTPSVPIWFLDGNYSECSAPFQQSVVCGFGGVGLNVTQSSNLTLQIQTYRNQYGNVYTPRCLFLNYRNETYLNTNQTFSVNLQSWVSDTNVITAIGERVFRNQVEISLGDVECGNSVLFTNEAVRFWGGEVFRDTPSKFVSRLTIEI